MKNSKLVPKNNLYKKLRSFDEGGDIIYEGKLPFDGIVVYPSQKQQREAAAKRAENATSAWRNFDTASDLTEQEKLSIKDKENPSGFFGLMTRILGRTNGDCINTATHWITNAHSVAINQRLFENPEKYGFSRVSLPQRGDLIQYIGQGERYPSHAGIVLSRDQNGTSVRSSNGDGKINPVRNYTADGKATSRAFTDMDIDNAIYYRYTYPKSGVYFEINGKETKDY